MSDSTLVSPHPQYSILDLQSFGLQIQVSYDIPGEPSENICRQMDELQTTAMMKFLGNPNYNAAIIGNYCLMESRAYELGGGHVFLRLRLRGNDLLDFRSMHEWFSAIEAELGIEYTTIRRAKTPAQKMLDDEAEARTRALQPSH